MTGILHKMVYVSWFSSARLAKPDYEAAVQWLGLARLLTNPHKRRIAADERAVPFISFARFAGARRTENVQEITAVVLNFDGVAKYETIRRFAGGCEFVAYSTHGHTAETPRFRVILPATRGLAPAEWPRIHAIANAMLGSKADASTREPAHIFPLPSAPAKRRELAFAFHNVGRLLDPDVLLTASAPSRAVLLPSEAV